MRRASRALAPRRRPAPCRRRQERHSPAQRWLRRLPAVRAVPAMLPALRGEPARDALRAVAEPEAEQVAHDAGAACHSARTSLSPSRARWRWRTPSPMPSPVSWRMAHTAMARTSGEAIAEQRLDARQQACVAGVAGGDQHVAHEAVASRALDRRAGKARAERGVVELAATRRAADCRSRRARGSVLRAPWRRTCSTGTRRGSRRSRTCGCPWRGGTRPGCGPCARSTGRRGSGAHRAGTAPGTPPSGKRRGSAGSCRSGRPPASSGGSSAVVKMAPRNSHEPCSRDTSMVFLPCQPRPAAAASGFSITGAVSTNTFTSAPLVVGEARGELLQLALEDVVVVLALRVDRDGAARRVVERIERICLRRVAHAEHDDRAHLRPQRVSGCGGGRRASPSTPCRRGAPRRGTRRSRPPAAAVASGDVTRTASKPSARASRSTMSLSAVVT